MRIYIGVLVVFISTPVWSNPAIEQLKEHYTLFDAVHSEVEFLETNSETPLCQRLETTRVAIGVTWLLLETQRTVFIDQVQSLDQLPLRVITSTTSKLSASAVSGSILQTWRVFVP